MRNLLLVTTLTFSIALTAGSASANLVANGSFEDGDFVNTAANYMRLNAGDPALTGWTVADTVAWGLAPTDGNTASDGVGFVDLSGFSAESPNGELQQILSTVSGLSYAFSIDRQGGAIDVSIDGAPVALTAGGSNGAWTTYTGTFEATTAASLLSIANAAPGNRIVFIDRISVVPEPGSLGLTLLGLAFVTSASRRGAARRS